MTPRKKSSGLARTLVLWALLALPEMNLARRTAFVGLSSSKRSAQRTLSRDPAHRLPRQIERIRPVSCRPFVSTQRYQQASSDDTTSLAATSPRKELLQQSLKSIQFDANGIHDASLKSIQDPTAGYDGTYGKSAIRTYQAFLNPKKKDDRLDDDPLKLQAAADRCARQIDFLLKRHKSHEAEWVRHNDVTHGDTQQRQTFPLILLLDNVRSAFNVGSIFRTADAAGCERVLTTGITPHPNGSGAEKLRKSALGADMVVPSQHFRTTQEAVEFLRRELPDYQLVGMETTERSLPYTELAYSKKGTVLVLGNEVTGVDTEILTVLDSIVELPMFGAKNSLNIAACAPVVLYEVIRQWQL